MEEPSVLDYLKSKLQFWEKGNKVILPGDDEPSAADDETPGLPEDDLPVMADSAVPPLEQPSRDWDFKKFPWRSLLALLFTLTAQRTLEPSTDRVFLPGLFLYGIGLIFLVQAALRGEWQPAELPEQGQGSDPLRVRLIPLILALVFSLIAFVFLGRVAFMGDSPAFQGNMFTLWNLSLWLLAIAFFAWAFWVKVPAGEPWWKRAWRALTTNAWRSTNVRWTLLVLVVAAVVIFFRVYNINGVPSEPFSDHAEKILDVYDVTQGQTHIFFPRNTGREAIQIYLTAFVSWLFGTGLSFMSLKIGTVLCGLATLPYIYLLGRELGGKRVALLALLFAGIAYWPNVISRVGLRFPLYPLFVAPTLFYLLRGLRRRNRNDFILSGIALGIGLHGYSPIRILPFVVVTAFVLFLLHRQSKGTRKQAVVWLMILAAAALVIFLPLLRYWLEDPGGFGSRAFSRLGSSEAPLPGPAVQLFFSNLWNALKMFNWDDGEIWVHSVTHRPALDIVSAALFIAGFVLLLVRYIKNRNWVDLFLLLSIPLLQMPSILSLAFPAENPALNRAGGALVPVFVIVALALDGLLTTIRTRLTGRGGALLAWGLALGLITWSAAQNYNLVFNQYARQFDGGAWNSSEMGAVIKQFGQTYGETDTTWIVPYPYWVDTRLPGVWAGIPNRDFGVWPEDLDTTLAAQGPKLFIVNLEDEIGKARLELLYPAGTWSRYNSRTRLEGKDFLIYSVPADQ